MDMSKDSPECGEYVQNNWKKSPEDKSIGIRLGIVFWAD
jgi:hypothetical protein